MFGENVNNLKPAEFRTFMILFKEIFKSGGQLIKIEDLVKSTGIKERTLYRHIDKCESEGLLVKIRLIVAETLLDSLILIVISAEEKIKYSGTKVFESLEAFGIKSKILMN